MKFGNGGSEKLLFPVYTIGGRGTAQELRRIGPLDVHGIGRSASVCRENIRAQQGL